MLNFTPWAGKESFLKCDNKVNFNIFFKNILNLNFKKQINISLNIKL